MVHSDIPQGARGLRSRGDSYPLHRPEIGEALSVGDSIMARVIGQTEVIFSQGATIADSDMPCSAVYRIRTGWACRVRDLSDQCRQSQILTVFLPGDLMGVECMMQEKQHDAIECLSTVTATSLPQAQLRDLARSDSDVALRLMFHLVEGERRLRKHLIGLGRGNAEERIASMLLDFYLRLECTGLVSDRSYRCPMTQQQIANYSGLTIVHVNRVLKRLRHAGLATMLRGQVTLHDLHGMEKLANPLLDDFDRERLRQGSQGDASEARSCGFTGLRTPPEVEVRAAKRRRCR